MGTKREKKVKEAQSTHINLSRNAQVEMLLEHLKPNTRYRLKSRLHSLRILLQPIGFRIAEIIFTLPILFFLSLPLYCILVARFFITGEKIFTIKEIVGKDGIKTMISPFNLSFSPLKNLALFFHILTGKLSLIGTAIEEYSAKEANIELSSPRKLKPGLFSLWFIRKGSKIGHEGKPATEREYYFTSSFTSDLMLIFRTLPAYLFSTKENGEQPKILSLLDIRFWNIRMEEAITLIGEAVEANKEPQSFYFINPDCFNKTRSDPDYLKVLQQSDHIFPDGIGINIACKIIKTPLKENINGTDMLPFLCQMAKNRNYSIFLLGGKPGVAEMMEEKITYEYGVKVCGTHHGYFDLLHESGKVINSINNSGANIVLVAFGAPSQEKWIDTYKDQLKAGAILGVGGLFDFYSGKTKRAPRWLREIGLEWSYRLFQEPGRMWRRYIIGNPIFLLRVLRWRNKVCTDSVHQGV